MRFITLNVLFVVQWIQHEYLLIRACEQCSGCSRRRQHRRSGSPSSRGTLTLLSDATARAGQKAQNAQCRAPFASWLNKKKEKSAFSFSLWPQKERACNKFLQRRSIVSEHLSTVGAGCGLCTSKYFSDFALRGKYDPRRSTWLLHSHLIFFTPPEKTCMFNPPGNILNYIIVSYRLPLLSNARLCDIQHSGQLTESWAADETGTSVPLSHRVSSSTNDQLHVFQPEALPLTDSDPSWQHVT